MVVSGLIDFLNAKPPTADRDHRNDRHADDVGIRRPESRRGFRAERPRGHSRDRADELIHVRGRTRARPPVSLRMAARLIIRAVAKLPELLQKT